MDSHNMTVRNRITIHRRPSDGQPGKDGKSLDSVTEQYVLTNSTSAPGDSAAWSENPSIPTAELRYLWNREKRTWNAGTDSETSDCTKPHIISRYTKDGDPGATIQSVVNHYLLNNVLFPAPKYDALGWQADPDPVPTPSEEARYLWNYEEVTYSVGEPTRTKPHIVGTMGKNGKGMTYQDFVDGGGLERMKVDVADALNADDAFRNAVKGKDGVGVKTVTVEYTRCTYSEKSDVSSHAASLTWVADIDKAKPTKEAPYQWKRTKTEYSGGEVSPTVVYEFVRKLLTLNVGSDNALYADGEKISNSLRGDDGATGSSYTENLVLKSNVAVQNSNYQVNSYSLSEECENKTVTVTVWGSLSANRSYFQAFSDGGYQSVCVVSKVSEGVYRGVGVFKYYDKRNPKKIYIFAIPSSGSGVSRIDRIKVEYGINSNPVWTPNSSEMIGTTGATGATGATPEIGADGKWKINGVDTGKIAVPTVDASVTDGKLTIKVNGTTKVNAVKVEGDRGSNTLILKSNYNKPLSDWKIWESLSNNTSGFNDSNNGYTVISTAGVRVGDIVHIQGTLSNMNNEKCFLIGTVISIPDATRVWINNAVLMYGSTGPTNTSQLTNDSDFATQKWVTDKKYATTSQIPVFDVTTGELKMVSKSGENAVDVHINFSTGKYYVCNQGAQTCGVQKSFGGGVAALSDERLKEKVADIELTLDQIADAPSWLFDWKKDSGLEGRSAGSIAQYWEKLIPEVTDNLGVGDTKRLNYAVAGLLAAINTAREARAKLAELSEDLAESKREASEAKQEVAKMREEMKEIRRMMNIG